MISLVGNKLINVFAIYCMKHHFYYTNAMDLETWEMKFFFKVEMNLWSKGENVVFKFYAGCE